MIRKKPRSAKKIARYAPASMEDRHRQYLVQPLGITPHTYRSEALGIWGPNYCYCYKKKRTVPEFLIFFFDGLIQNIRTKDRAALGAGVRRTSAHSAPCHRRKEQHGAHAEKKAPLRRYVAVETPYLAFFFLLCLRLPTCTGSTASYHSLLPSCQYQPYARRIAAEMDLLLLCKPLRSGEICRPSDKQ
jgi:hypothetical protein